LGGLAALFGNSEEKPQQDSEKLMDLYWNRAQLKKSFADARKEHYRLEDKIKQQEGAIARIQQKLDHLEDLLIDPQWVHNVVVFYQLRGLAQRCERTLAKFAEELLTEWKGQLAEESAQVEEQLVVQRHMMQQLEDQILADREQLEAMGIFARIFKGRSVKISLRQLEQQISTARTAESSLLGELVAIKDRVPPENKGLGVSSKRSINVMILAFAQQLYLQFSDREFAALVKESSEKSVGSVNYGNPHECAQMLERINECIDIMEQDSDFADVLRQRATLISKNAEFRHKTDVVPVAASTATLFAIDDEGLVQERKAELLGENYWGIAKVLSR
jgi:YesN/AraC family two-component response regulator